MENFIYKLFKEETSRLPVQFLRFALVGGFATLIDFGVYSLLLALGVHINIAIFAGFVIGYIANYLLSSFWVFHSENPFSPKLLIRFGIVALIGLGINYAVVHLLLGARVFESLFPSLSITLAQMAAKLVATITATIWNFIGRRWFVYR